MSVDIARDHVGGLDEDAAGLANASAHQAAEQGGRLVAGLFRAERHAGQRRIGQLAQHFVVVHADHRHVVGHLQGGAAAGFENLAAAIVVAGQHAHRLGKSSQPLAQDRFVRGPNGRPAPRPRDGKDVAGEPGLGEPLGKTPALPLLGPWIIAPHA